MREDSPTSFVKFRRKRTPYERALELVRHVQLALDQAQARHYLKDRLDRRVTALAMALVRVDAELPSQRWRVYRKAYAYALDCRAELDVLGAQQREVGEHLVAAIAAAKRLCDDLAKLGRC